MNNNFQLTQDIHGRITLTLSDGSSHDWVLPVRAFPLSAPNEFIVLMSEDGHELLNVPCLSDLDVSQRNIIINLLAEREFMPQIEKIIACSTFSTPSSWAVITDHGKTKFILKAEEDIRRLANGRLIITDSHGLQFEIVDQNKLDANSKRILTRFL